MAGQISVGTNGRLSTGVNGMCFAAGSVAKREFFGVGERIRANDDVGEDLTEVDIWGGIVGGISEERKWKFTQVLLFV